eukprot:scaffold4387_cov400-Prasinococcus_capsulatus_cf.AAC.8
MVRTVVLAMAALGFAAAQEETASWETAAQATTEAAQGSGLLGATLSAPRHFADMAGVVNRPEVAALMDSMLGPQTTAWETVNEAATAAQATMDAGKGALLGSSLPEGPSALGGSLSAVLGPQATTWETVNAAAAAAAEMPDQAAASGEWEDAADATASAGSGGLLGATLDSAAEEDEQQRDVAAANSWEAAAQATVGGSQGGLLGRAQSAEPAPADGERGGALVAYGAGGGAFLLVALLAAAALLALFRSRRRPRVARFTPLHAVSHVEYDAETLGRL